MSVLDHGGARHVYIRQAPQFSEVPSSRQYSAGDESAKRALDQTVQPEVSLAAGNPVGLVELAEPSQYPVVARNEHLRFEGLDRKPQTAKRVPFVVDEGLRGGSHPV